MNLPQEFTDSMKELLGAEEYEAYLNSAGQERVHGLRVNTSKITVEEFLKLTPFSLKPIPWVENGFFYDDSQSVTKHPHYHAGLYYVQEPSAMIPADRLPVTEGDCVLDLCAAPGGKATELGAKLKGTGVLVANDISNSRAKGLLKNLELFGIPDMLVTSETPQKLLPYFEGFFDKILIDAPCSGEGMFRKDPAMVKSWLEHGPEYYAAIQKEILLTAADMLKPGGLMLYSTCTFSALEDECSIAYLLAERPDFEVIPMKGYEGFGKGIPEAADGDEQLENCVRIWPHKMAGEGHFAALLKKNGDFPVTKEAAKQIKKKQVLPKECQEFFDQYLKTDLTDRTITVYDNRVYAIPTALGNIRGLRFLRTGLYLGEIKKNRFEPSQALAMSLKREQAKYSISFSGGDGRAVKYLKGETIELEDDEAKGLKGWILVCVDGYPLGFAKAAGGSLKNKYYPGWRLQ